MPKIEHEVSFGKVGVGITDHIKRHKVAYSFGAGIAVAGVTCFIMRNVISQPVGSSITETRNKVVMKNVSFFMI